MLARRCLLVSSMVLFACSGGSNDDAKESDSGAKSQPERSGTPCEQLAQTICPLMQACPEEDGPSSDCMTSDSIEGSSLTVGFSCSMCRSVFEKDVCGDKTKSDDLFRACIAALDAGKATCSVIKPERGEKGLVLPSECHTLFECNSGPCEH